jgi:hypothetical protein
MIQSKIRKVIKMNYKAFQPKPEQDTFAISQEMILLARTDKYK